ncbi:hypothetical protein LSM04_004084 [Trypanosoma melophagium]|uniref:uncharacterized protein n=1 Tax=Trypanosoma melophagium TaxID=715481 RepID=UPI003519FEF5|nr:hypothetical protein LSM04_004084 [Trypanosoma melophagium]
MKPDNQSARGASRSSWGSLSGFILYFFPRDGDEADDAVASTSLAWTLAMGCAACKGNPLKKRTALQRGLPRTENGNYHTSTFPHKNASLFGRARTPGEFSVWRVPCVCRCCALSGLFSVVSGRIFAHKLTVVGGGLFRCFGLCRPGGVAAAACHDFGWVAVLRPKRAASTTASPVLICCFIGCGSCFGRGRGLEAPGPA